LSAPVASRCGSAHSNTLHAPPALPFQKTEQGFETQKQSMNYNEQ
jgi:hypothetical protein